MKNLIQLIAALVSTAGFCLMYHLPRRHIPLAAGGAAACWAVYLLLRSRIGNLFYLVLLVSIFSAAYAEIAAKYAKAPATLFLIPALIPLVPGSYVYYMMLSLVQDNYIATRRYGLLTAQWAIGLAAGISLVAAAEQILYRREGSGGAGCPGAAVPERTAAPSAAPEKAAAASGPDGREEP